MEYNHWIGSALFLPARCNFFFQRISYTYIYIIYIWGTLAASCAAHFEFIFGHFDFRVTASLSLLLRTILKIIICPMLHTYIRHLQIASIPWCVIVGSLALSLHSKSPIGTDVAQAVRDGTHTHTHTTGTACNRSGVFQFRYVGDLWVQQIKENNDNFLTLSTALLRNTFQQNSKTQVYAT